MRARLCIIAAIAAVAAVAPYARMSARLRAQSPQTPVIVPVNQEPHHRPVFANDELAVKPIDIVMGHHFTSTYPGSHFTTGLILAKHLPGRHVTVTHELVTVRVPGEPTEHRPLRDGEVAEWLERLEVGLTRDEEIALHAKLSAIAGG